MTCLRWGLRMPFYKIPSLRQRSVFLRDEDVLTFKRVTACANLSKAIRIIAGALRESDEKFGRPSNKEHSLKEKVRFYRN